ncbi:hypothetical protein HOP50_10g58360 [Chloropicon primus]|uniref:Uncharacterized protein n=1 Tax=Chloropicon primus TaxID=1764295 RepID=A0A5B8MRE4_9CHLO|nr:hypothetical protein A3770_10p58160 [Chloropicon primus]UPR02510.1 hypothetical protein HOP50_10g58360 [Chloropicon primus]|eukprot:QDZ23298.1 hypothetical protein A3770_10p58160 [Chloropicon primus]
MDEKTRAQFIKNVPCQTEESFVLEVDTMRQEIDSIKDELAKAYESSEKFEKKVQFQLPSVIEMLKEEFKANLREFTDQSRKENEKRVRQQQAASKVLVKNKEMEVRAEFENRIKGQISEIHKELIEKEKILQDALDDSKKKLVLKDQKIDDLSAKILHLEAKIESQVLTGDEESLEAKLNQFKSQLESSQNIAEALRQELFRRQSEFTEIALKNRQLEGSAVELEKALKQEREEKITLRNQVRMETEILQDLHNKQLAKMTEELREARERANAIYQDYERESQITDIMVNRYQTIITKLTDENRTLKATLLKSVSEYDGADKGQLPHLDGRRKMSVTDRLYTPVSRQGDKFLKDTPIHAPNPLVIRQKLRNMNSLQLQMENVQNQYRDKLKNIGVSTPGSQRSRSRTSIPFSGQGKVQTVRSKRLNSVSDVAPMGDLLWSSKQ